MRARAGLLFETRLRRRGCASLGPAGIWNESDEESALASRAPQQVRLLLGPAFLLRLTHVGPFKAARKWQTDSS